MANIQSAIDALRKAVDSDRVRNIPIKWDVSYGDRDPDDGKVRICAYGILSLRLGYSLEETRNMACTGDLKDIINERFDIPYRVGQIMENESDDRGWSSALSVLELYNECQDLGELEDALYDHD